MLEARHAKLGTLKCLKFSEVFQHLNSLTQDLQPPPPPVDSGHISILILLDLTAASSTIHQSTLPSRLEKSLHIITTCLV